MAAWETVPLGEALTFQRGFDITKDEQRDGPFPVISSSGPKSSHAEFKVRGPGVIIGRKGSLGTVFYSDGNYWPHDTTLWIKDFHGNHPRFAYYFLQTMGFERLDAGASNPSLNRNHIHTIPVLWPKLPIQQRIAGILSAYDELIENSQRRIKILEAMARALYREWFVHFRFAGHENHPRVASPLGEIPQGWEVKRLGDISSYINRGITPRYDEEGDSVVINQKCVRDQRLNLEPARRQSKAIPSEKQVCFGDVLINSTGVGTLGRVAQVYENLENCTVDTHVTIARAARDTDLDFYGCCLLSLQETFERLGIGATGQTELGRAAISDIEVVVPPANLQRQFGEAARGMRLAAMTHGRQIQNLRRTRDLLLPRLLSGQIEVGAACSETVCC